MSIKTVENSKSSRKSTRRQAETTIPNRRVYRPWSPMAEAENNGAIEIDAFLST